MRIEVCRPQVPFISGWAELQNDELVAQLTRIRNEARFGCGTFLGSLLGPVKKSPLDTEGQESCIGHLREPIGLLERPCGG
jgi:hypothetical protein